MEMKKYILGVDDEPINQVILNEMLNEYYEIDCATDGNSCLESVNERLPDLILLDVNMPGKSGLEVCQQLREDPSTSNVPIIFVSALASKEERMAGYHAGGDDYVTKPFVEEELLQKIKLLLSHQADKDGLKKTTDETMGLLMTTLTSTSELGVVITFVRESYGCHTIDELTKAVFNAIKIYELEGSILITAFDEPSVYFSDDVHRSLERDVLMNINSQERIFTFGKRVVFKTPYATLLIRNMPNDAEKTGRFKDHLAILMDGLDARIQGIIYEMEAAEKQKALEKVVDAARKNLEVIDEQHKSLRLQNAHILSNMGQSIEESFLHLGLSESQEQALLDMVTKTETETDQLYEEGVKTDDQFDLIMRQLSESLSSSDADLPDKITTNTL